MPLPGQLSVTINTEALVINSNTAASIGIPAQSAGRVTARNNVFLVRISVSSLTRVSPQ